MASLVPVSNTVYDCLEDKGWDVEITWDGGIEASSATIPSEQRDVFAADSAACWAVIDERVARMGPDEIEQVYRQELDTRSCMIDEDYDVESPPSLQEYVDRFHGDRWTAYGASSITSTALSDAEWLHIAQACPQPAWSFGAAE